MDLLRHIRVLWKHRLAMALGILAGALLATLVAYDVHPGQSPIVTPRGEEQWKSVSRLLVTQEGFPEGRVTLPEAPSAAARKQTGGLQFADPGRFQGLASLYAVLASSDQVRSRLSQRPMREQITALVVDPDGPGSLAALPVIELSTTADSAANARKLNTDTVAALRSVLSEQQDQNLIEEESRVRLDQLDFASAPIQVTARSRTASIVVFMIALLGAIAFAQFSEGAGGMRGFGSRPRDGDPRAAEDDFQSTLVEHPLSASNMPERPAPPSPRDEVAASSKLRRL